MPQANLTLTHIAIRAASQSSAMNDVANQRTTFVSIADDPANALILRGRPLLQQNPDNTQTTYFYDLDPVSDKLIVTTRSGTTASPHGIADKSTYTVEHIDANYGRTTALEKYLYAGEQAADILLEFESSYYNNDDRLISTEYSDGTYTSNIWDCCRMTSTIARDGTVSEYYDISGQPSWSASGQTTQGLLPGAGGFFTVQESYTDALGRETNSVRSVRNATFEQSGAYAPQTTTTAYPFGTDNFSVTTDPLGIATTNIITWNGGKNITITSRAGITTTSESIAGGAKITTTEWTDSVSDENLKKMTKTESAIQPNGWKKTISSVKYDDGEWLSQSETFSDLLGRTVSIKTPLGTTSNFYSSMSGRLVKVCQTGMADTLYVYSALGEVIETIVDVNGNGSIDYSGPDQITKSESGYEQISNEWWRVTSSAVYHQTNSANCITSSISRVRMTGLGEDTYNGGILTDQSETEDWLGNVTRTSAYTDADNATTWQVVDTPTSIHKSIQKSISGYPIQHISSTAITNSYTYDGFARQVSATDGRTNTTFTAYNDFGQVSYTQSSTNKMCYFYNGFGQRTMVSNALGQVNHTAYNQQGQTIATWGTSYPVAYQFDTAGRMVALATTRSNAYANVNLNTLLPSGEALSDCSIPALDITQWRYDESTGLLTNKVYADGNGTFYTYTDAGRVATRTWARGKTTTYTYGDLGQITNVDYSDSTPDVTYTHDRLGRITSATSSASTSTFYYDGLTRDYETQNGYIIKRRQDILGREIGYELYNPVDLVNPCQIVQYGYDCFNRLGTVTSVIGAETNVFTYTYLLGTDLVSGMSSDSGIQWCRYYESERDLITAITNSVGSVPSVVSSFDYINDPLGRRTKRTDYFNASTITNDFIYNQNSEVIGATMNDDDYDYEFDPIGNRQTSVYNALTNSYTANQLNQYTAITGDMSFIPTHDDDGNMTFSGSWHHTWDAENRMIKSEPHSATNGSVMFEYRYNYKNLRVEKTKKQLSGRSPSYPFDPSGAGTWDAVKTRRYIWDGWNIVAEIITDHVIPATNIAYYTWGLDLAGTLQGAGGVGGLLCDTKVTNPETNSYFAVGDVNGNITEYVDITGATVAHGEHNAFGETKLSGSMKKQFTHWFSTKPFDKETELVVYQRRYYDPILGRWLSNDPIGINGGMNKYGFVVNDGMNNIDPKGLRLRSSLAAHVVVYRNWNPLLGPSMMDHHYDPEMGGIISGEVEQTAWFEKNYSGWTEYIKNTWRAEIHEAIKKVSCYSKLTEQRDGRVKLIEPYYSGPPIFGTFIPRSANEDANETEHGDDPQSRQSADKALGHFSFTLEQNMVDIFYYPGKGYCWAAQLVIIDDLGLNVDDPARKAYPILGGARGVFPERTIIRARWMLAGCGCCTKGGNVRDKPVRDFLLFPF